MKKYLKRSYRCDEIADGTYRVYRVTKILLDTMFWPKYDTTYVYLGDAKGPSDIDRVIKSDILTLTPGRIMSTTTYDACGRRNDSEGW